MSTAVPPSEVPKTIPVVGLEPRVLRFDLSVRTLLIIVAAVAVIWLLIHLLPALLVLVTAFMLVGALNPAVAWLEKKKIRRNFAIGIVFALVVVALLGFVLALLPPLVAQVKTLGAHEAEIRGKIADYLSRSAFTSALADQLKNVRYEELFKSARTTLLTATTLAFEIVAYIVASIFLAAYILIDRDRLRGALFAVVPRAYHIKLSRILLDLGTIVGGYIRGQVITCALMTAFLLILLLACRVPNALAIATFGGLMDLLPYIGIVLTMVPAVLAALVKGPAIATAVFVILFIYEEFEGRILIPLVYGRALRLPSSVVFFSLIAGSVLAGVIGALLALPIAAAVLMLVENLRVELPGEAPQPEDLDERREDSRTEEEYLQRAGNMPAEKAAAVAVEISGERKKEERDADKADPPPKRKRQ